MMKIYSGSHKVPVLCKYSLGCTCRPSSHTARSLERDFVQASSQLTCYLTPAGCSYYSFGRRSRAATRFRTGLRMCCRSNIGRAAKPLHPITSMEEACGSPPKPFVPNCTTFRASKRQFAGQMSAGDIEDLHKAACAAKQTFYEDPATGLLVFTSHHLSQRPCCHSGCRHCPYTSTTAPPARVLSGCLDDLPERVDVHFWSGGKDSFLTLRSKPNRDVVLLTTYDAAAGRVAMQDVAIQDVIRQAKTLDIPLLGVPVGDNYVQNIGAALKKLRDAGLEIQRLVFGDLHLAHIRKWRETELTRLGVELHFPLWKVSYKSLMKWLKESGIVIRVSAVDRDNHRLKGVKVGDIFDDDFVRSLPDQVDNFGENGEFHTLVEVWNKRP